MTPEMLGYFSEELSRNASKGVQNLVSNVNLLKGRVSEAWEEGDLQYATAYMRWTANDVDVRIGRSPNDCRLHRQRHPRVQPKRRKSGFRSEPRRQVAALRCSAGLRQVAPLIPAAR